MRIYVQSKNVAQGPYSFEQVKDMVFHKKVRLLDMAQIEGTYKWITVVQLIQDKGQSNSVGALRNQNLSSSLRVVQEYKRVCQQCGKVWHSLIARENQIARNIKSNNCQQSLQACTCSPVGNAGAAQSRRNVEANQSDLAKLISCPACNSTNFTQEIISYETK